MADAKVAAGSGSYHRFTEVEAAKKVHIYTNGDKYFAGKNFVVNPRQLRDFDAFLNQVTLSLRPAFGAVRAIRTPRAGHKVGSLTLLEHGKSYVAAGGGKFVKIGYEEITSLLQKAKETSPRETISKRKLQVSGRVRKIKLEPIDILIYANGETMEPPRRLLIKPWVERDWENVLATIDEKVQLRSGAVRRLIDVSTKQEVKEIKDLKSHQQYVAVGSEKFKDLEYGQMEATLSPRQVQKRRYPQLPPLKKKSSTNESGSEAADAHASSEHGSQNSKAENEPTARAAPAHKAKDDEEDQQQTAASAPEPGSSGAPASKDVPAQHHPPPSKKAAPAAAAGAAGRKPAAGKEPAAGAAKEPPAGGAAKEPKQKAPKADEPAATVVPQKPLKHRRSGQEKKELKEAGSGPTPAAAASNQEKSVDLDKDEGGIYKAKAKDVEAAEEVTEDNHTKQEVPVDRRAAEEVAEEERPYNGGDEAPGKESERRLEPSPPAPEARLSGSKSRRSVVGSGRRSRRRTAKRSAVTGELEDSKGRTPVAPVDSDSPAPAEAAPVDDRPPQSPAAASTTADDAGLSEDEAAKRIQAAYRGHQVRRNAAAQPAQAASEAEAERADTPPTKYVREEQAAVVIQAAYRGHMTRSQLRGGKSSMPAAAAEATKEEGAAQAHQPPAANESDAISSRDAKAAAPDTAREDNEGEDELLSVEEFSVSLDDFESGSDDVDELTWSAAAESAASQRCASLEAARSLGSVDDAPAPVVAPPTPFAAESQLHGRESTRSRPCGTSLHVSDRASCERERIPPQPPRRHRRSTRLAAGAAASVARRTVGGRTSSACSRVGDGSPPACSRTLRGRSAGSFTESCSEQRRRRRRLRKSRSAVESGGQPDAASYRRRRRRHSPRESD